MQGRKFSPSTIILVLFAIIAIPATLSLHSVRHPGNFTLTTQNPSPLGYTLSLSMFIVPIAVMLLWLHRNRAFKLQQKAFWITVGSLASVGFILDIFFGSLFFNFQNRAATLGLYLPGFNFQTGAWTLALPIEEFAFYITGFLAVLLLYIWGDEYWFSAYNLQSYQTETGKIGRMLSIHIFSLAVGIFILMAAILYKKLGNHPYRNGFPRYFTYLTVVGIAPAVFLFKTSRSFINWRSFSFTLFFVTLISLLWEVTLALPYQWWGYNYEQMVGITIGAWFGLPIEAVIVWLAVTFTTIIIFEAVKIRLHLDDKSLKTVLFGMKADS